MTKCKLVKNTKFRVSPDTIPNVPNLRFPGFEGEWESRKLSTYLYENKERNRAGEFNKSDVLSVSGDCGIVNQIELLGRSFAGKSVADYHIVRTGNIVYTKSPLKEYPYGIVKYNSGKDGIVSTLYAVYHHRENVNGRFVEHYFTSPQRTNRYFKPIVRIGAKHDMKIGNDEVLDNSVLFPGLDEQNRITELLDLLNQRIAIQNKVIEKYKSLISAIIQHSQRHAIRNVYLRDVLSERKELNTAGYDIFSVSVSQGVINQIEYLGRSFAAKETSHYHVVRDGDIVYTKSPTGDFPYGIVKQSQQKEPVAVSPLYGVYEPVTKEMGTYLHFYFYSPENTKNYLSRLIQKGAKNTINITNQHFLDNTVKVPEDSSLKAVVIIVSKLSQLIELEEKRAIALQRQKAFFLSNLFI